VGVGGWAPPPHPPIPNPQSPIPISSFFDKNDKNISKKIII